MYRRPPEATRTDTLFPDTTLFRSLLVGEIVLPGKGLEIGPTTLDAAAVSSNVARAHEDSVVAQLLAIIPGSFLGALAGGTCSRCWSHRCFPALDRKGVV